MDLLNLLIALVPILAVFLLLVVFKLPAVKAMPTSLVITSILTVLVWKVQPIHVLASIIEGLIISLSILWIIFGAILLLNTLVLTGSMDILRNSLKHISSDRRVQVVIIAWLFGALIEGMAGFGTPVAICAPLLVAIGFPPIAAATLALVANSSPVVFGAMGTPFVIGVTKGLSEGQSISPIVNNALIATGSFEKFMDSTALQAILINVFVGSLIPTVLIVILTRYFGKNRSWKEGFELWKFALFAGFSFTIPALIVTYFWGPEFSSLLGALFGLAIVIPAARKGFLLSEKPWDFNEDETYTQQTKEKDRSILAWLPYALITFLFIFTRLRQLPFKGSLQAVKISFPRILGTSFGTTLEPLYNPGTIFITVVFVIILVQNMSKIDVCKVFSKSTSTMRNSVIAIGTAIPMVRIFINSGVNTSGLSSMPIELAKFISNLVGRNWPVFSPMIGSLGSFLSGSATFSNMMFSLFQFSIANEVGISESIVIALQLVGASAGNMVSILNVIAAGTVVGLPNREGEIIRATIAPMIFYVLLAGIIGMIMSLI